MTKSKSSRRRASNGEKKVTSGAQPTSDDVASTVAVAGRATGIPLKRSHADSDPLDRLDAATTCLHVQRVQQKAGVRQTEANLLQRLLGPIDANAFLQRCFRHCAVHVRAADAKQASKKPKNEHESIKSHFRDILSELDDLDVIDLLQQTSSDNIFVWLQPTQSSMGDTRETSHKRIHSIEVGDPESAYHLYQAGHAVYCRAPPSIEQSLVSSLLAETGLGCGQYDSTGSRTTTLGRGEVEVFLSSTAGHVTEWHYDFQENFTLQVSGVKQWTLHKGTVRHPIRACTPHYNSPGTVESQLLAARLSNPNFGYTNGPSRDAFNAVGDSETVTLHPGDVFYFPAGMWHQVKVLEPGLSLNVSLMASTMASVTCQALQQVLLQKDEWRQCVQHSPRAGVHVVDQLQSLLETLPDVIRELSQTCRLAEAILPPALLQPTVTGHGVATAGNDDDDDDDDDDDEQEDNGDAPIVHVASFVPSSKSLSTLTAERLDQWRDSHRLVKNPLATLLHEAGEIQKCYKVDINEANDDDSEERTDVFVLNVNFAGNESLESSLRVRLAANAESIRAIVDLVDPRHTSIVEEAKNQTQTHGATLPSDTAWLSSHLQHVDCLVYYGYLLWSSERKKKV